MNKTITLVEKSHHCIAGVSFNSKHYIVLGLIITNTKLYFPSSNLIFTEQRKKCTRLFLNSTKKTKHVELVVLKSWELGAPKSHFEEIYFTFNVHTGLIMSNRDLESKSLAICSVYLKTCHINQSNRNSQNKVIREFLNLEVLGVQSKGENKFL